MNLGFKEIRAEDAKEMVPFYSLRKNRPVTVFFWKALSGGIFIRCAMQSGKEKPFSG